MLNWHSCLAFSFWYNCSLFFITLSFTFFKMINFNINWYHVNRLVLYPLTTLEKLCFQEVEKATCRMKWVKYTKKTSINDEIFPPQETHSPLSVFLKPFLKRFPISRYLTLLMLSAKKELILRVSRLYMSYLNSPDPQT